MIMLTGTLTASSVRYLVVVRRGEESTYRYLKDRLASVTDVEVMIDRRGGEETTATERRRKPSAFNAFGVALVRR